MLATVGGTGLGYGASLGDRALLPSWRRDGIEASRFWGVGGRGGGRGLRAAQQQQQQQQQVDGGVDEGELDLEEGEDLAVADEATRADAETDMDLVVPVEGKGSLAGLAGGAQMLRGKDSSTQRIDMLFGSLDTAGLRRELYLAMGWRRVRTTAPDGTDESSWEYDGTKQRNVESFIELIQLRLQLEVAKVDSLTACCPKTASEDIICVCNSVYGAIGGGGASAEGEAQKKAKGGKGVADGLSLSVNNKYVEVLGAGAIGKSKKVSPQREDCLIRLMNNRIEEHFAAVQANLKEAGASRDVPRPSSATGSVKWTPKDERWVQECIVHETNSKKKESREQKQMQEMAMQLAKSMSGYERKHATITFKHSGLVKMVPLSELLEKSAEGKMLLDGGKS